MNETRTTHINRVKELQKLLKSGELTVTLVTEKSNVNRGTVSNLKTGKVTPEKMTDSTLQKLSNFYTSPENPANNNSSDEERSYKFGQLLAIMELLLANLRSGYGLKQDEMQQYEKRPMSTFQTLHERIVSGNMQEYLELQDEIMYAVNKLSFEEFSDEPLKPSYMLGYYRKRAELKEDKNYYNHIKGYGFQNKPATHPDEEE